MSTDYANARNHLLFSQTPNVREEEEKQGEEEQEEEAIHVHIHDEVVDMSEVLVAMGS